MSNGGSKGSTSSGFHLIAGLGSGFTSAILLQPADLLKTRLQQSGSRSLVGTFREILQQPRPIRELWRGTLPSAIRTSVGSALYFTTLTQLRKKLAASRTFTYIPDHNDNARFPAGRRSGSESGRSSGNGGSSALPKLAPAANLLAGAFSRASIGLLLMPITVLKVRYESSLFRYDSLLSACRDVFRREGIKGFFAGFGATAIRDAPYAGLYVLLYEQGKKVLNNAVPTSTSTSTPALMGMHTSASINFASSVMAASGATFMTNPPDAIKTRLQLQPQKYRNTIFALKLMLREEGLRSLFDGLALRMARKAMSSALAWTVYEECIRWAELRLA